MPFLPPNQQHQITEGRVGKSKARKKQEKEERKNKKLQPALLGANKKSKNDFNKNTKPKHSTFADRTTTQTRPLSTVIYRYLVFNCTKFSNVTQHGAVKLRQLSFLFFCHSVSVCLSVCE